MLFGVPATGHGGFSRKSDTELPRRSVLTRKVRRTSAGVGWTGTPASASARGAGCGVRDFELEPR